MTKTCPDCQATVLSTSQPAAAECDWPPPFELMKLQARGPETGNWIDIYPAQLEQMLKQGLDIRVIEPPAALAATPAVGGEARETLWGQIAAVYGNLDVEDCAWIDREWMKMRNIIAGQPASPLRGETFYFGTDPKALADRIIGIQEDLPDEHDRAALGEIAHYLRKAAVLCPDCGRDVDDPTHATYCAAPEQPASPLRGRALTENERHAIAHAKYQCDCSSPSDPEVRFDYELVKTLLSLIASSPEQPALRGRESVREIAHRHCTCTCRDDPKVMQNHTNLCDEISDAILEYAVLSSAAPEQPAARKWTGPGYLEQTGYTTPDKETP